MRVLRLKNGFNRLSDADLSVKAGIILANLTGNVHFPSPAPTLVQLTETLEAYSVAVQKSQDKSLQQIAQKNELRKRLITQLHLLGNYVLLCAAGDEVVASSSGFGIGKPRQPRPPLTKPEEVVLRSGPNRGELLLTLKRVPNVLGYLYQITPHPATAESQWVTSGSTLSKFKFANLLSGREYCCRVSAIGVHDQMMYSEVVSRIVL